jgi:hypothetical protein
MPPGPTPMAPPRGRYNCPVADDGVVSAEDIEYPSGDGECEACGKKGLLARITSRTSHRHVRICDECLGDYRRGNSDIAAMVISRLRPL